MAINSPDIFDSVGDAVVTGGGSGVSTFVALNDTPANYTGSGSKLVAVNSTPDALEFVDRFFTIHNGLTGGAPSTLLLPFVYTFGSLSLTTYNTYIIPEKCELDSIQLMFNGNAGDVQFDILKPASNEFGTDASTITALESVTLLASTLDTLYKINFSNLSSFDEGDLFAVRWTPTVATSYFIFTIKFKILL